MIQGRLRLDMLIFDGMNLSMHSVRKSRIFFQFVSTELSSGEDNRNSEENFSAATLRLHSLARWNWWIFLCGAYLVFGYPEKVKVTISWSEMPGLVDTLVIRFGFEVSIKSKVLPDMGRVTSLTTWAKEKSSMASSRSW